METFDFIRDKLTEWGLSGLIPRFEENKIDRESFEVLQESDINDLIKDIGPRAKFKQKHKKFLKILKRARKRQRDIPGPTQKEKQNAQASKRDMGQKREEERQSPGRGRRGERSEQTGPSTSNLSTVPVHEKGKRKFDFQTESSKKKLRLSEPHWGSGLGTSSGKIKFDSDTKKLPSEPHCGSAVGTSSEAKMLGEVKEIIKYVHHKLDEQGPTKLNAFLKDKIRDLERGKKEFVGVFGKTGAGKSSLINAIIGEKGLLPSGSVSACTSVMIKVEANMSNSMYMAEIEFITKKEWEDELWSSKKHTPENSLAQENEHSDDDYDDSNEKIAALYGTDVMKSPEELMDSKYFREIPEFFKSTKKILICGTASELSEKLAKYTRSDEKDEGRDYWPLVKCVTIKVPNVTGLLEHVTLVDLPGNGDCNKSRDEMWKACVGSCSTVWIVTDTNRAASEKEPWEILEKTVSLMGNGGECQRIFFICTKSDSIEDSNVM